MPEFPLDILLKIIKLAWSTYYYHLKQLKQEDKNQVLKNKIQTIYTSLKEFMEIPVSLLRLETVVSS